MRFRAWMIAPLALFCLCAGLVLSGVTTEAELAVYDAAGQLLGPVFRAVMFAFTTLGNTGSVIFILAVLVLLPWTRKRVGLPAALAVTASWILNTSLKFLFARMRPDVDRLIEVSGYSFPSGHAMNNLTLYLSVLLALLLIVRSRSAKWWFIALFVAVPFLIGLSRIYFGAHYVTDVAAGWSLGLVIAFLAHDLYFKTLLPKWENRKQGSAT